MPSDHVPAKSTPVLLDWLPRGHTLSQEVWLQRHRWLLALLWLHVPALAIFGAAHGKGVLHSICEASLLAFFALLGSYARDRRKLASGAVSIGMLVSSALLVHFANGVTEAHFHFFVMISLLTLYEDWTRSCWPSASCCCTTAWAARWAATASSCTRARA